MVYIAAVRLHPHPPYRPTRLPLQFTQQGRTLEQHHPRHGIPAASDAAAEVLRDTDGLVFIDTPLGTRKAFGNTASQGLAITELKPQDTKATQEFGTLYGYLYDVSEISQ